MTKRRFIIDTDTASDDAVAILMALRRLKSDRFFTSSFPILVPSSH